MGKVRLLAQNLLHPNGRQCVLQQIQNVGLHNLSLLAINVQFLQGTDFPTQKYRHRCHRCVLLHTLHSKVQGALHHNQRLHLEFRVLDFEY